MPLRVFFAFNVIGRFGTFQSFKFFFCIFSLVKKKKKATISVHELVSVSVPVSVCVKVDESEYNH